MDWSYLLKVSIVFSVLYLLYLAFLQWNTFHKLNRIWLLFILPVSLLLPQIKISNQAFNNNLTPISQFKFGEYSELLTQSQISETNHTGISIQSFLAVIYFVGVSLFLFRFLISLTHLFLDRYFAKNKKQGRFTFIFPNRKTKPHSFFYWIFIPDSLFTESGSDTIIEHEKTHAKQLHSLDIVIAEFFTAVFWFLPFSHLYKRSLKNIHEYLADQSFTINTESKINYLEILSRETENLIFSGITNTFYSMALKKRISMISKPNTQKIKVIQYAVLIPVIAVLTMAFSQNAPQSKTNILIPADKITTKSKTSFIYPIQKGEYKITSTFGERMHPIKKKLMMHNGVDFAAKTGTNVKASASGKIIKREFKENSYGNVLVIEHVNGHVTLYSQLSEFKSELGELVKQGDIIGLVGSSGMSTGPHLHFELRKNDEYLNPEDYLK